MADTINVALAMPSTANELNSRNALLSKEVARLNAEKSSLAAELEFLRRQVASRQQAEDPAAVNPRPAKKAKLSAEDKERAKIAKQRATDFKKCAGECMKIGMQWNGSRFVAFTIKVELEAFDLVFDGSSADRFNAQSTKTGKNMVLIKLQGDEVAEVFGKTRANKSFRYGGSGTIHSMDVLFDPSEGKASCSCSWGTDLGMGFGW